MAKITGSTGSALVLTALLAVPGCTQWGDSNWGSQPYAVRNSVVDGQVWSVDRRRGRIQVRSDRGRTSTVRVDNSTRITYDRRSYPLDALERGDVVRVWVDVDRRGEAWADRVDVRSSARGRAQGGLRDRVLDPARGRYGSGEYEEGYRAGYRAARLEGRVEAIDLRSRYFRVAPDGARAGVGVVSVHLPQNLDRDELRKVERLRRGERVRLDVRAYSQTDAELIALR